VIARACSRFGNFLKQNEAQKKAAAFRRFEFHSKDESATLSQIIESMSRRIEMLCRIFSIFCAICSES